MEFKSYKIYLSGSGNFQIKMNESCHCQMALADFHIPNINQHGFEENGVELTCEQIDSTFDNPRRLVKRLLFNRLSKDENFNSWEAKWFDFKLVDSNDDFLNFTIKRLNKHSVRVNKNVKDRFIYLTLVFKPISEKKLHWNAI